MASKAQLERMRRLKAATETVEAELNRLEPVSLDYEVRDAFYAVIRHLKRRWAEEHEDAAVSATNGPGRTEGVVHE